MHISHRRGSSWLFKDFFFFFFWNHSVQRHRDIFWLHLHVKWTALLCGREVPSRQPVPCGLSDWAHQKPFLFPTCWGGAWQHSATHLKVCQSSHWPTGVSLLKSSRLARTNTARAQGLPLSRTDEIHGQDMWKAREGAADYHVTRLQRPCHGIKRSIKQKQRELTDSKERGDGVWTNSLRLAL